MDKKAPNPNRTEDQPQAPGQGGHMTESSPNPHNEATITPNPVRTDQAQETEGQNVAQTPSTRDGRLHPSVAEGIAGGVADHDSMFNNADPQSRTVTPSGAKTSHRQDRPEHSKDKKSA